MPQIQNFFFQTRIYSQKNLLWKFYDKLLDFIIGGHIVKLLELIKIERFYIK